MTITRSYKLTTFEYIVLGLISKGYQSGHHIMSKLEHGARWNDSQAVLYPTLKRLEIYGFVEVSLHGVNETERQNVYSLTERGSEILDSWLLMPPDEEKMMDERYVILEKFVFLENRVTLKTILNWLDTCEASIGAYQELRMPWNKAALDPMSVHNQLVYEAEVMELNAMRMWVQMARARLRAEAHRTGEFRAIQSSNS
jgi:DNA-binding PadR family transcriptional regulator